MDAPRIIIGLGNPGEKYAHNRHNAGFLVADALASQGGVLRWSTECLAQTCKVSLEARPVMLVKPQTFMNRCGDAVRLLCSRYKIERQDMLVMLDDFSLPLGRIRIRERGSAGGHHGLESILQAVESDEILRLRLGIGEERMPDDKAEFVLSDFPAEKVAEVSGMISRACDAVKAVLRDGVASAMAVFNA